jgi:hypothetical protein
MIELLVKLLSAIPVISAGLAKFFHRMQIISPSGAEPIEYTKITVIGTCLFKPRGDWVMFTQRNDLFWPQGDVQFSHTNNTWKAIVWLNPKSVDPPLIIVAQVSSEIRYLVDYYRMVAPTANPSHPGIKMRVRPEGLKIASQVIVQKKSM